MDSKGQVIGINSAIIQEAQGIGFAIPINTAKSIADQLIKEGRVRRGSIGITYIYFNEHTKTLAERQFRMKLPANQGFLITAVRKGGPADKAGLYRAMWWLSSTGARSCPNGVSRMWWLIQRLVRQSASSFTGRRTDEKDHPCGGSHRLTASPQVIPWGFLWGQDYCRVSGMLP